MQLLVIMLSLFHFLMKCWKNSGEARVALRRSLHKSMKINKKAFFFLSEWGFHPQQVGIFHHHKRKFSKTHFKIIFENMMHRSALKDMVDFCVTSQFPVTYYFLFDCSLRVSVHPIQSNPMCSYLHAVSQHANIC